MVEAVQLNRTYTAAPSCAAVVGLIETRGGGSTVTVSSNEVRAMAASVFAEATSARAARAPLPSKRSRLQPR
jgi:hypothetical protein